MLLMKTELERSNFGSNCGVEIARIVYTPGISLNTYQEPPEFDTTKHVDDLLITLHVDVEFALLGRPAHSQPLGGVDFAAQVGLGSLEDLVVSDAIELVDHHGHLWGEAIEQASNSRTKNLMGFVRQEILEDASEHHSGGEERGSGGEHRLGGGQFGFREKVDCVIHGKANGVAWGEDERSG